MLPAHIPCSMIALSIVNTKIQNYFQRHMVGDRILWMFHFLQNLFGVSFRIALIDGLVTNILLILFAC